jgi:hypothetical protein
MVSRFDELALSSENSFSDVGSEHWAVSYINSAAVKGWVSGFGDGTFRPQENITRAQVVTIVNRMLVRKIELEDISEDVTVFVDLTKNHWAYCEIMEAVHGHTYQMNDKESEIWVEYYHNEKPQNFAI